MKKFKGIAEVYSKNDKIWIISYDKKGMRYQKIIPKKHWNNLYFLKDSMKRKDIRAYLSTYTKYGDDLFHELFEKKEDKPIRPRNIIIIGANKDAVKS